MSALIKLLQITWVTFNLVCRSALGFVDPLSRERVAILHVKGSRNSLGRVGEANQS